MSDEPWKFFSYTDIRHGHLPHVTMFDVEELTGNHIYQNI